MMEDYAAGVVDHSRMLRDQLIKECRAMAGHSLARGRKVSANAIEIIDAFEVKQRQMPVNKEGDQDCKQDGSLNEIKELSLIHEELSQIVEPAIPQAIVALNELKESGYGKFLSPIPLIRHMMMVALVSLTLFVGIVLSPDINDGGTNIFNAEGLPLLINLLFILSAAGLGASFSALYKANEYITNLTFDQKHQASYWIRFLLGLISGLLLAVVISENAIKSEFLEEGIIRPLLALLGGFSADLVHTFLNRMVETLKSLFQGSNRTIVDARTQQEKANLAGKAINNQMKLAGDVMKIQQEINTKSNPEDIQSKLNDLLTKLIPDVEKPGSA